MDNKANDVSRTVGAMKTVIGALPIKQLFQPILVPGCTTEGESQVPQSSRRGLSSAYTGQSDYGSQCVDILNERKVQGLRLKALTTTQYNFKANNIPNGYQEVFFISTPIQPPEVELSPDGKNEFEYMLGHDPIAYKQLHILKVVSLLKRTLNPVQAVSVVLSLWATIFEGEFKAPFGLAIDACGMQTTEATYEQLEALCSNPASQGPQAGPDEALFDLMLSPVVLTIVSYTFLAMIKQITKENHVAYWKARIKAFTSRLGMSSEQAQLIEDWATPKLETCNAIYSKIGNRVQFRRVIYAFTRNFVKSDNSDASDVASILTVLMSNLEITHLVLIQKYVIDVAPGILTCDLVRNEATAIYRAMKRLADLGNEAQYVRLLCDPMETPELNSSQVPLLTALARHQALQDHPSFVNYAGQRSEQFKSTLDKLIVEFKRMAPITTKTGASLLAAEYNADEAIMVRGILHGTLTRATNPYNEILNGLNN